MTCPDLKRLCFHVQIQTHDISKTSTPQYMVSGRFRAEFWIGHGQTYKISALQKLAIERPLSHLSWYAKIRD
jgi:hypothetical protein